jgi:D-alanyl-D-alanine carboxypeptidase/D-alanyl-D-alanine-endopeptidase (penicillin-binding protein 4)
LTKVLNLFVPYAELLKRRSRANYKTGTMSGVRTLAGYVDTAKHGRVRFVIALKGSTGALRYRLMQEIERGL